MLVSIFDLKVDKKHLYDDVSKMYPFKKLSYNKVSKNDLMELIVQFYSDYKNILSICSLNEFLLLKKLYNIKNYNAKSIVERSSLSNLIDKYLLIRDSNTTYFFKEIDDSIKEAIKNFNKEEMKKNDKINDIANKLSLLFPFDDIYSFSKRVNDVLKADLDETINLLINNRCFLYHVNIVNINDISYFIMDNVYAYYKEIYEERRKNEEFPLFIFSLKELENRYYKLVNYLLSGVEDETLGEAIAYIRFFVNLNKPIDEIFKILAKEIPNLDLDKYKDLLIDIASNIPSCSLYGLSINEYNKALENQKYKVEQENAKLKDKDYKVFNKLYTALLDYTNNKYNIIAIKDIYNYDFKGYYKDLKDVIDYFFNNKKVIIEEFIKNNPYNFTSNELEMVKEFNKAITNEFTIVLTTKDYLGLLLDDNIYMVKTLACNFDQTIDIKMLPIIATTSIVQFNNDIVCCGVYEGDQLIDDEFYETLENNKNIKKVYSL
mgnify:CR=1 FL=1